MADKSPSNYSWTVLGGFLAPGTQAALDAVGASLPSTTSGPTRAAARLGAGRLFVRLIPGLSVAATAVLIWEMNQRAAYHDKQSAKVGPSPGDPGYMPSGYSKIDSRVVPGTVPGDRYFAGVGAYPIGSWPPPEVDPHPDLYPPPFGPPESGFAQIGTTSKFEVFPGIWSYYATERWLKDGTGPGSSKVRYGRVVEWQPAQDAWPLSPDALPSVAPALAPFSVPPGRALMPVPQRLVYRVGTLTDEILVERVSVSPRPVPDLEGRPDRPPALRPEIPTPTVPDVVIDPAEGSSLAPPSHVYAPPREGVREVKLRARTPWLFRRAFGALTEMHDFIGAVHKALPKRCRRSRSWRGSDGKWHRALATSMLRDIKNCAGDINIQRAIINVVANAIQDAAIGLSNRALNSRSGMLGSTVGVQGLGTRLSRGQAGSDSHWSTAITDAGDWVAAQSPGYTANDFLAGVGMTDARLPTGSRFKDRRGGKQVLY